MCHRRHAVRPRVEEAARRDRVPRFEEAAPRDPVPRAEDPALRASDAERESAVSLLREHGAAGRLDVDELEQRVGAAYAARTRGELAALLADLPGELPVRRRTAAPSRRHARIGHEWAAFLQVAFVLVAVWAIAGAGYFWPVWVLVWWACPLLVRSGPRLLRPR